MGTPFNNWYHVTLHTYGSWLPGDPRGHRTRHHEEHIEGDYKHPPPPGAHAQTLQRSLALMKSEPVRIPSNLREPILSAFISRLQDDGIEPIAASLDATHLHLLARFNDHNIRHWTGLAKKHASHTARQHNLRANPGGLWSKRSRAQPIADRQHQIAAFRYILRHQQQGALVWKTVRDLTLQASSLLLTPTR